MVFAPSDCIFSSRRSSGFTLIEVIIVLIILGILAAVAVSRGNFDTDQWVNPDVFASHLRYAQSRAMAMEHPWGLEATGGTYTMFQVDEGTKKNVALPGSSEAAKKVPNGTWWFDGMGRPYFGKEYKADVSPTNTNITINVAGKIVTITAITGYVP